MLSAPTRTPPALSSRETSVASRLRRRPLAVDLRAGPGRQPLDVEEVLDGERRAGQWPKPFAACASRVDRLGPGKRARRRDVGKRAERAVPRFDALKRRLGHFAGAGRAAPQLQRRSPQPNRPRAEDSRPEHRRRLQAIVELLGEQQFRLLRRDPHLQDAPRRAIPAVSASPSSGAIASTRASGSNGGGVTRPHVKEAGGGVQPSGTLAISVPPYSVRWWCGRRRRPRSDRRPCPRRSRRRGRTIRGFRRDPRTPAAPRRRDCAAP